MLQIIGLIIFCFGFALIVWRNLLLGIIVIVALLPVYLARFHLGLLPMTLLEAMILILFIVWLIKNGLQSASWRTRDTLQELQSWRWPIIAWLAAATIAVIVAPDKRAALGIWKAYFFEPILFLLVFVSVVKKDNLKFIFGALGFSAMYISIFAIYQKFTGFAIPNPFWQAVETRRVTSFFGYPNAVGLYLAPIITFYFGWLFQKTKNIFWLACKLLVIGLSLAAIIFAVSEGAIAAVFLSVLIIGLIIPKARWPVLISAVIILATIFYYPEVKELIWQKATLQDFSGQLRLTMWGETWQMLQNNLFFGAGLTGYQQAVAIYHKAKYIEIYLYPHNFILNFWSELGLLGLGVFLWLVIKSFKDGLTALLSAHEESAKIIPVALMGAMSTILIHGLVDVPYFKNDLAIIFWLIIGNLLVIKINKTETST